MKVNVGRIVDLSSKICLMRELCNEMNRQAIWLLLDRYPLRHTSFMAVFHLENRLGKAVSVVVFLLKGETGWLDQKRQYIIVAEGRGMGNVQYLRLRGIFLTTMPRLSGLILPSSLHYRTFASS